MPWGIAQRNVHCLFLFPLINYPLPLLQIKYKNVRKKKSRILCTFIFVKYIMKYMTSLTRYQYSSIFKIIISQHVPSEIIIFYSFSLKYLPASYLRFGTLIAPTRLISCIFAIGKVITKLLKWNALEYIFVIRGRRKGNFGNGQIIEFVLD